MKCTIIIELSVIFHTMGLSLDYEQIKSLPGILIYA